MISLSRLGVSLAIAWLAIAAAHGQTGRPNIIHIMADDLGYGDLGCYGQKVIQTPNLDRMAAEGLRFTDHYAGHTVCRPSRLVVWTGRNVGHTGLIGNRDRSLTGTEPTVARLLQEAGYATGGVGKWALGNVDAPAQVDTPGHPIHNGFDNWFGYLNQGNAHNYFPPFLWDNLEPFALSGNVLMTDADDPNAHGRVSKKRVTWSHDTMTERAFAFVRRNADKPFLLHIHWTIPHANNEGGRVLGDGMEIPDYGIYADRDWPNPEKGFAAMITRMDADVGRLFDLLKELGIDGRTLVLFTSDNGAHQEGGHQVEFFDSNGPLRGFKRSMHEGGIRVPLIARWPGNIAPGTESDHPSAFWDYLPTACEVAGVEPPPGIDGISYLPTLLGKPKEQKPHEYLYWASSEGETSVGIRQGNWKLVQYRTKTPKAAKGDATAPAPPKPDWRLYDLTADLGEDRDIAAEHPDIVERLKASAYRDELAGLDPPKDAAASEEKQIVIALVGDSTVTDSAGWGLAFAGKFRSNVRVLNFAAGGRSAKSWLAEGRLPAVLEAKPDYVFIQFGHNGQPGKGPERETDPATTYRDYLRQYVKEFRAIGAEPILVSSVTRRDFIADGTIRLQPTADDSYGEGVTRPLLPWAEAAKAVAAEVDAPFIDLYRASVAYHNRIGKAASATFSPKPGDITHFNELGAEAIANLVVAELRKAEPKLAKSLK